MHLRFTLGALLVLFSLSLASCNQSPPSHNDESSTILRIAVNAEPDHFDPRLARNLSSTTFMSMLFEGLMRVNLEGQLVPGIADKVETSSDGKIYTFTLRESFWSNDDPLTADDFVASWKTTLDPAFPASNAFQLFVIKGAKAAKEGKGSLDAVGVYSRGPATLVVELEQPTPYFLELTAFHPFFPINSTWVREHPDWAKGPEEFVSNGPFRWEKRSPHNFIEVQKNVRYWDSIAVNLDKILFYVLDDHTAFQLFSTGDLDWTGSPLSTLPPDSIKSLKEEGSLNSAAALGTHWFRINIEKVPLNSRKMRQALSYAMDRQAIVEHVLQGNQIAATAVVPPGITLEGGKPYFADNQVAVAKKLFQEALQELKLSPDTLPPITITYSANERAHKLAQAVQQQWQTAFPVQIKLESIDSKVFYDRLSRQDYQISLGSWFADFRDPVNFLNVFKFKNFSTNNTNWENPEYAALLEKSSGISDPKERKDLLRKAEQLLIADAAVIPLFYSTFNYLKKENLHGVYFSDIGFIDFKYAYLDEED